MPGKPLRFYIAGVVTLSVIALMGVATLVFPPESRIALTFAVGEIAGVTAGSGEPSQIQILGGIAFWTLVTLLASAAPVQLPRGSHHAVALAPIVAAMSLGGPAVAGWVAAIGTTEMREIRGRIPVVRLTYQSRWGDTAGCRWRRGAIRITSADLGT